MTKRRPPTVVVDIDGVLAGPCDDWDYAQCPPILSGIRMVRRLKLEGFTVVLHSARWEEDRAVTVSWMLDHDVPFDKLVLGKPSGDVYLDDRSFPEPFDPERNIGFIDYLIDAVRRRHADHDDHEK